MAGWEQYEVWIQNDDKWELIALFGDIEIASALAHNRSNKRRLLRAVYENGNLLSQDVLAELGTTRETGDGHEGDIS